MSDKGEEQHDRTAEFVQLLRQNDRQLTAYVHALMPGWYDAEDVLQETSIRLWEQFDKYEPGTNFGAWACTIARYLVLAHRERSGRERLYFNQELLDQVGEEVTRMAEEEGDARRRLLAECISELSGRNRDLLAKYYAGREKVKDIALKLRRTTNAVYLAMSRVRRRLHECVERKLAEEHVP